MSWKRIVVSSAIVVAISLASYGLVRWKARRVATIQVLPAADSLDAGVSVQANNADPEFLANLGTEQIAALKMVPKESIPLYAAGMCVVYTSPLNERAVAKLVTTLRNHQDLYRPVIGKATPTDTDALLCLGSLAEACAREGRPVSEPNELSEIAIAYAQRTDVSEKLLGTLLAWTILAETAGSPERLKSAFDTAYANAHIKSELPIQIKSLAEFRMKGNLPPLEYAGLSTGKAE